MINIFIFDSRALFYHYPIFRRVTQAMLDIPWAMGLVLGDEIERLDKLNMPCRQDLVTHVLP